MPTKHIWRQEDREFPMARERRTVMQAEAALAALWGVYDAELDTLRFRAPALFKRALEPVADALNWAQTLFEAYDYFLARCQDAGMLPEAAQAAWEEHSSEAFEAELVEAERLGPNALAMIDATILGRLGLPPHAEAEDDA